MTSLAKGFAGAMGMLMLCASSAWADGGRVHERGRWYIGFGIGGGDAGYTIDGKYAGFSDMMKGFQTARVAINFQVGGTVLKQLLVGFDLTGIREGGSATVAGYGGTYTLNAATQITTYNAMVTYFPNITGFFVRGGTGLAVAIVEISGGGVSASDTVSGFDAVVGGGYAFWLLKSFNLTVGLDLSQQFYGKTTGKPENSQFWNFNLGFMWY